MIDQYTKSKCFSCGGKTEEKYHDGCKPCYLGCCKGKTASMMVMTDNGIIYVDKQGLIRTPEKVVNNVEPVRFMEFHGCVT